MQDTPVSDPVKQVGPLSAKQMWVVRPEGGEERDYYCRKTEMTTLTPKGTNLYYYYNDNKETYKLKEIFWQNAFHTIGSIVYDFYISISFIVGYLQNQYK